MVFGVFFLPPSKKVPLYKNHHLSASLFSQLSQRNKYFLSILILICGVVQISMRLKQRWQLLCWLRNQKICLPLPRQEKKVANFGRVPSRHHR
jgi:hypothetical protein